MPVLLLFSIVCYLLMLFCCCLQKFSKKKSFNLNCCLDRRNRVGINGSKNEKKLRKTIHIYIYIFIYLYIYNEQRTIRTTVDQISLLFFFFDNASGILFGSGLNDGFIWAVGYFFVVFFVVVVGKY